MVQHEGLSFDILCGYFYILLTYTRVRGLLIVTTKVPDILTRMQFIIQFFVHECISKWKWLSFTSTRHGAQHELLKGRSCLVELVFVVHNKTFFLLIHIQHTQCPRWFFILEDTSSVVTKLRHRQQYVLPGRQ